MLFGMSLSDRWAVNRLLAELLASFWRLLLGLGAIAFPTEALGPDLGLSLALGLACIYWLWLGAYPLVSCLFWVTVWSGP